MKTKNLVLGLAATAFAVSGVYASSFIIAKSVRFPSSSTPGAPLTCRQINVDCGSGSAVCKVVITNPPTGVSAGPYDVYELENCTVRVVTAQSTNPIPVTL